MNKNIIYVLFVILIVGGIFFFTNKTEPVVNPVQENSQVILKENITKDTPKAGEYTMAEVAIHNNKSDCWSAINGSVYNLTTWISSHPGGALAIISLCGKNGSAAFNGQHEGGAQQASQLATFKIGILVN